MSERGRPAPKPPQSADDSSRQVLAAPSRQFSPFACTGLHWPLELTGCVCPEGSRGEAGREAEARRAGGGSSREEAAQGCGRRGCQPGARDRAAGQSARACEAEGVARSRELEAAEAGAARRARGREVRTLSRSDSGRRVVSSYTRPKSNVTRASEAATSLTNSDASRTWLIYATRRSNEFEAIFFRHSELAQP